MKFWEELKRRKIFQVATVYLIVGWLLIQVAATIFPVFNFPGWTLTFVVSLIMLGFPVALVLAWAYQLTAAPATNEASTPTASRKPAGKRNLFIIGGVAILSFVLGAYFLIPWQNFGSEKKKKISIAIIPFRNQTGNTKLDGYSYGIASEIRTQLAISGQFDFISSDQATLKYLDSKQSPKEIASELGVDFLVFGQFYQLDDKLKISAELADGDTNKSLWSLPPSDATVSSLQQMFIAQSAVAVKVMDWFSMEGQVSSTPPTEDLSAYDYYLRGQKLQIILDTGCISLFKKSIALDSNFLKPRVGLFIEHAVAYWNDGNDDLIREAELKPEIAKIEKIAPNAWETNLARGYYYYWGLKDYNKGLQYFKKVIEVFPDCDDALAMIGVIYRRQLKPEEAFPYLLRSIEMNPASAQNRLNLYYFYYHVGDTQQSWEALIGARNLGNSDRNAWNSFIEMALDSGDFSFLPDGIRDVNPTAYDALAAGARKDWNEFVKYPGNLLRAIGYYHLNNMDSARFYANRLIEANRMSGSYFMTPQMMILTGDVDGGLQVAKSNAEIRHPTHFGSNVLNVCFIKLDMVKILALAGKYKQATDSLIALNKSYPSWGNYQGLKNAFETQKILREYPPFKAALRNLKLPKRFPLPEKLRKVKSSGDQPSM